MKYIFREVTDSGLLAHIDKEKCSHLAGGRLGSVMRLRSASQMVAEIDGGMGDGLYREGYQTRRTIKCDGFVSQFEYSTCLQ